MSILALTLPEVILVLAVVWTLTSFVIAALIVRASRGGDR